MFKINLNNVRRKIAHVVMPKEGKPLPINGAIMVDGTRISAEEAIARFDAQRVVHPPAPEGQAPILGHREF